MINFFINRPVSVIVVFIAVLVLGLYTITKIPVTPLPSIEIPEISVFVSGKNASAIELEKSAVKVLREQLQQIPDVENLTSKTMDGSGAIRIRFKYSTNMDHAYLDVSEKVDQAMTLLPREMSRPKIVKSNSSQIPVFYLNVMLRKGHEFSPSSRFIELSDFATQVFKRQLEQLPEVAYADVSGSVSSQICLTPKVNVFSNLNLTQEDFRAILENANVQLGSISASEGAVEYSIRFASENISSTGDIADLTFRYRGRLLRIGDIADVTLKESQESGLVLSDTKKAVCLAIIKQPEANLPDLRKSVQKLIVELNRQYGEIEVLQTQDQTALLDFSISNLKQDLLIGCVIAFCLMYIFHKNIYSPLLIIITIPVSVVISIMLFHFFGLTINIISLAGLVLGVGLMIDNSIIVIDNINQELRKGGALNQACVIGTQGVLKPLIASTFTTCSVFVPLIYLSGISGALFYDQAVAITIGLTVSLATSISLLPTLLKLLYGLTEFSPANGDNDDKKEDFFEKVYHRGFRWVFDHKILSIAIVSTLFCFSVVIFMKLKKERMPELIASEIVAQIDWNNNVTLEENTKRTVAIIQRLNHWLKHSDALVGEQKFLMNANKNLSKTESQIYFSLKDDIEISRFTSLINDYLKEEYPNTSISLFPPKSIFEQLFGDDEADFVLKFYQVLDNILPDNEQFVELDEGIKTQCPGVTILRNPVVSTFTMISDPDQLLHYGLSPDKVHQKLTTLFTGNVITSINDGKSGIPVTIGSDYNILFKTISEASVENISGEKVPLSGFVHLKDQPAFKVINGDKSGNFIPLQIETKNDEQTLNYLSAIRKKYGHELTISGSYFNNKELTIEMFSVLGIAIALLYFILAAQFESLAQPFIILMELPISFCGAFIMLYLFGCTVNLMSLIGLIVMSGIIINDSILKLDTINKLIRKDKMPLMEAIKTAGNKRLKAIIMTAATTVLSVAPFVLGTDVGAKLQQPLALALIGGMIIGTPVSLYFIPMVYYSYYRKRITS